MPDTEIASSGETNPNLPIVISPAKENATFTDAHAAARALAQIRWKRDNPTKSTESAAAPTEDAAPTESEAKADEAAPVTGQPSGETTEAPEPASEPPIEPPRFWTSEAKERFSSLPRETQSYIVEREQARDTELRRIQNEAAEKSKGLTAKEQAAEQARQRYEEALPTLLSTLQEQQQGEFSDIKTMADVEKLAREDWPRYIQWDLKQKQIAAVTQEVSSAKERQSQEIAKVWNDYAAKQDQLLIEKVPELSDKSKIGKVQESALSLLKDIGFPEEELANAWNGRAPLSLRDHRIQLLILDGIKYREAKANIAKPAAKPVPPVQRPGTSKAPVSAADAELQSFEDAFKKNPNPKTGAALRAARIRASA